MLFVDHPAVTVVSLLVCVVALCVFELLRAPRRDASRDREVAELTAALDAKDRECAQMTAQWQALLAAVSDPIFLIDNHGVCYPANAPAERLFPPVEHQTVLSMTQSPELDALYQEARSGDGDDGEDFGPQRVVAEISLRYPKERVMHVSIDPISIPGSMDGAQLAFVVILRDLTDLRRLELVRRDFVANVSHELRTPLSSVKAMAETLIDGALHDPEVAQHFLETIIRESDRLVRLSADLLDLSRVESRPVAKEPTDLAELTREVSDRFVAQAREAGIVMSVELPEHLVAPSDSDEIAQVLVNLIDNAIKYTPRDGNVWIRASDHPTELVFSVTDTGIGILRQDLARLFERFYRADKARSRASGGTGLGLAIVKHIVERHGGRVWVESEYNHGSTFWFSIPKA
jgi:two-component system phosphate regulon sensor histidine kinase PhoR